jgi:hypothetical protein
MGRGTVVEQVEVGEQIGRGCGLRQGKVALQPGPAEEPAHFLGRKIIQGSTGQPAASKGKVRMSPLRSRKLTRLA